MKSLRKIFTTENDLTLYILLISIICVWLIIALPLFYFHHHFYSYAGTLGDTMGIISSLFSSLAFAGLFYTILLQKKELRATRDAFTSQKMDSAFFSMVSILQKIIESMSADKEGLKQNDAIKLKGRDYIKEALNDLKSYFGESFSHLRMNVSTGHLNKYIPPLLLHIQQVRDTDRNMNDTIEGDYNVKDCQDKLIEGYSRFFQVHQHNLGHYFRYIYNIIGYINGSNINIQEKRRYFELLQAQLSNDEMGLIFYEALQPSQQNGDCTFKVWLESNGLLENMDECSLYAHWHHWLFPYTNFKFLTVKELKDKETYRKHFL